MQVYQLYAKKGLVLYIDYTSIEYVIWKKMVGVN